MRKIKDGKKARNQPAEVLFVTGTDTDVGKTVVSVALLRALAANGYSTAGLKPVAAGAYYTDQGMRNEDALQLQQEATQFNEYEKVNPYLFEQALAPHVAANNEGQMMDKDKCVELCQPILTSNVDIVVVEGAGGWLVPLNYDHTMADLAGAMNARVLLVVGVKLGCINHALLTATAISQSGLSLVGWVANHLHPEMREAEATVKALKEHLKAPLIGELPFVAGPSLLGLESYLDILALKLDPAAQFSDQV